MGEEARDTLEERKLPASQDRPFVKEDGVVLAGASRQAIRTYLERQDIVIPDALRSPRYETKLGCFVTLKRDDAEKTLRGCIGFPEPILNFSEALTRASVHAATQDPRFKPVTTKELPTLLLEVSVLNRPRLIETRNPRELPSRVEIGTDGLIMRWNFGGGLLLPQVATEQEWDAEEFLVNLALKAGAPPDQWLVPGTQVLKFQCQIFSELEPGGAVEMI